MKRLAATGIERLVIGISGGLDFTQALIVAAKTMDRLGLPRKNILGYTMPAFATTEFTRNNALLLMEAVGVSSQEIDIRPSCMHMLKDLGHPFANGEPVYDIRARRRPPCAARPPSPPRRCGRARSRGRPCSPAEKRTGPVGNSARATAKTASTSPETRSISASRIGARAPPATVSPSSRASSTSAPSEVAGARPAGGRGSRTPGRARRRQPRRGRRRGRRPDRGRRGRGGRPAPGARPPRWAKKPLDWTAPARRLTVCTQARPERRSRSETPASARAWPGVS